jgi:hypothetical protein
LPFIAVPVSPAITMGKNCEISGVHVASDACAAISCGAIVADSNAVIHDSLFQVAGDANGIDLGDISLDAGNTVIYNNTFVGMDANSDTFGIFSAVTTGTITIQNNIFTGASPDTGLDLGIDIDPNFFHNATAPGSLLYVIDGNTFSSQTNTNVGMDFPGGIIVDLTNTAGLSGNVEIQMTNNAINIPAGIADAAGGVYAQNVPGAVPVTLSLINNRSITIPPVFGYRFVNDSGNPVLMQVPVFINNVGTRSGP